MVALIIARSTFNRPFGVLIIFSFVLSLTNGVCTDLPGWVGSNNHDCSWWASAPGHPCAFHGDDPLYGDAFEITANEACCACGERGLDEYESAKADTACLDSALQIGATVYTTSAVDCAAECLQLENCDGFEMHTDSGSCLLKQGCSSGNSQDSTGSTLYHRILAGAQGDPLITGLKGQVFKFDGRDDAWYANLAAENFHWNMQFREHDTCPAGEDMFISGFSFNIGDNPTNKILLSTTSEVIPECQNHPEEVCLGGGTLQISLDGGQTYITRPGDYSMNTPGYRIIAHNTYAACSRKWYDYNNDDSTNGETVVVNDPNRRRLQVLNKSATQYLIDQRGAMIDPSECERWTNDRMMNDDLFQQYGLWSTIHIETPIVAFHVEFRRSNLDDPQKDINQCSFESLDAWMTWVSPELKSQEWNGILGETRYNKSNDRAKLLRGKDDADYEVDGPFGTTFTASLEKVSLLGNIISTFF